MSVAGLSRKGGVGVGSPERPEGITCPRYESLPGEKRCRHYVKGGACALPDEFMCVEWLKANGHAAPTALAVSDTPKADPTTSAPTSPASTDLFGRPLHPEPPPATPSKKASAAPTAVRVNDAPKVDETPPLRGLTTEDIDGFKSLGVEVCLRSESFGEVWLVPAYTGRDRKEITPEHAATICRVVEAFPGSQVVSFEKSSPTEKEADA